MSQDVLLNDVFVRINLSNWLILRAGKKEYETAVSQTMVKHKILENPATIANLRMDHSYLHVRYC